MLCTEKDWREVLALVRKAAATPGYRGPVIESVERVAAAKSGNSDRRISSLSVK